MFPKMFPRMFLAMRRVVADLCLLAMVGAFLSAASAFVWLVMWFEERRWRYAGDTARTLCARRAWLDATISMVLVGVAFCGCGASC